MSQQPDEINDINDNINAHDENQRPDLEDFVYASVMLPIAHASILDYLYASGIPLRPMQLGGGGGAVDMDGVASILANSLYDRRPVKTVVNEEGMAELSEKIFTAQLAEELKINTVCGIWQDDFEEGERIKILPCNHAFKADAIDKWLTTEKAECPICRFSLSSKEVNCGHISSNIEDEYHVGGGGGEGGEAMAVDDSQDDDRFQQNIPQINENHIAARLADNIHNRLHREDPARAVYAGAYASRQSVSVPINQLLQSRRNMINNIARVSGGARGGLRFPPVAAAAAAAAPPAREPEPEAEAENPIPPPVADDDRPQYINNIYYVHNIINNNNNNNNHPDAERGDNGERRANINNNYYYDQYDNNISNRERDDIQEAIRRSLEEQ